MAPAFCCILKALQVSTGIKILETVKRISVKMNARENGCWRRLGWAARVTGEPSCGRWLVPQLWADLAEL